MNHNMSSDTLPHFLHLLIPNALHPFLLLSYPVSSAPAFVSPFGRFQPTLSPTLYDKGPQDLYFIVFCAMAFTVLREVVVRCLLRSFAWSWLNSSGKKRDRISRRQWRLRDHTATRFAEQGWSFCYCAVFWTLGMVVLFRIPDPTSPEQLWGTYPPIHLPALTKFYYLAQLGWWCHQIFVIHSEKRRSDHWQMFAHHVLSITLIITSYIGNFTRVGTLIHVLMDFCDILLPLAKMFRYLSLSTLCDATFVFFLISWLFSRQLGLFLVIRTSYLDAPRFIPFKWDPSRGRFLTKTTYYVWIGMQCFLLCLATVWFYMACMVAARVVRGLGAEDSRSDDEEEVASPLEEVPTMGSSSKHITPDAMTNGYGKGCEKGEVRQRWSVR